MKKHTPKTARPDSQFLIVIMNPSPLIEAAVGTVKLSMAMMKPLKELTATPAGAGQEERRTTMQHMYQKARKIKNSLKSAKKTLINLTMSPLGARHLF